MTIRYGLLGATNALDAHLKQLLEHVGFEVGAWPDVYTHVQSLEESAAQVLMINGTREFDDAVRVCKSLVGRLGMEIVILGESESTDNLRAAMRAGARDYLNPYKDARRLVDLFAEIEARLTGAPVGQGEVISMLGCRGGVGVTTLAMGLATYIAQDKRFAVVVVDVDQAGGDLVNSTEARSGYTTHDLLNAVDRLDVTRIRGAVVRRPSGVWVLPQPEEDLDTVTVTENDVAPLIAAVRRAFTHVIVDQGVALADAGRMICQEASHIVLIADQEIVSLRSAVRRLRIIQGLGVDKDRVHVVLNRYNPKRKPDKDEIARQLRTDIAATIVSDYESASAALDRGLSVVEHAPRSELAEDIAFLKARLMGEELPKRARGWWLRS